MAVITNSGGRYGLVFASVEKVRGVRGASDKTRILVFFPFQFLGCVRLVYYRILCPCFNDPQFNDEVQHLGPAFAGGYPKCYEPILQTPLVERT